MATELPCNCLQVREAFSGLAPQSGRARFPIRSRKPYQICFSPAFGCFDDVNMAHLRSPPLHQRTSHQHHQAQRPICHNVFSACGFPFHGAFWKSALCCGGFTGSRRPLIILGRRMAGHSRAPLHLIAMLSRDLPRPHDQMAWIHRSEEGVFGIAPSGSNFIAEVNKASANAKCWSRWRNLGR